MQHLFQVGDQLPAAETEKDQQTASGDKIAQAPRCIVYQRQDEAASTHSIQIVCGGRKAYNISNIVSESHVILNLLAVYHLFFLDYSVPFGLLPAIASIILESNLLKKRTPRRRKSTPTGMMTF